MRSNYLGCDFYGTILDEVFLKKYDITFHIIKQLDHPCIMKLYDFNNTWGIYQQGIANPLSSPLT